MASIDSYYTQGNKLRYRVRYRDPERNDRSKSGFVRKRDAEQFIIDLEIQFRNQTYVAPRAGNVTIENVYTEWLSILRVSPKTKHTREVTWGKHVKPRWANVLVSDVKKPAVEKWVTDMQDRGIGVPTIENALGVLRMTLTYAVEEKMVALNVAEKVRAPKRDNRRRPYLTHEQVQLLTEQLEDEPSIVVKFLAYTGMRWGEMSALQVQDMNILRREVTIARAITEVSGRVIEGNPKTHEARKVPIPKFLISEIVPLMDNKGANDRVFTSEQGMVLRNSTFRTRVFKPAVKACVAIDPMFPAHLTMHDLRHTCASLSISAGASVMVLQRMLGHASPSITLDVYADLFEGDLHTVADALDAAVIDLRTRNAV